jgi:hypothetical protein
MFGAILGAVFGGGGGGVLSGVLGGALGGGGGGLLGFGLQLAQTVLGGVQQLLGGVKDDLTGMRQNFDPRGGGAQSQLRQLEDRLDDIERQLRGCKCDEGSRPGRDGGKCLNDKFDDLSDQIRDLKGDLAELRRGGGRDCCEGGEGGDRGLDRVLGKLDRTLGDLSNVLDDLSGGPRCRPVRDCA